MPDPTAVHVRRATPSDAPEIVRLMLEVQAVHVAGRPDLFKPGGVEDAPQITARMSDPQQFFWVATVDGRVVGYAYGRLVDEHESTWRFAARTFILDQMGVDAGVRSRGVGNALWLVVRELAVAEGVDRVVLNVWSFNKDARRFYERLGFQPYNDRMSVEL